MIFSATADGNGGGAVKLNRDWNGKVTAEEIYFNSRMRHHHGGMIAIDFEGRRDQWRFPMRIPAM